MYVSIYNFPFQHETQLQRAQTERDQYHSYIDQQNQQTHHLQLQVKVAVNLSAAELLTPPRLNYLINSSPSTNPFSNFSAANLFWN